MLTLQQTVKVCQSWDRNQHCQITGLQFLKTPMSTLRIFNFK